MLVSNSNTPSDTSKQYIEAMKEVPNSGNLHKTPDTVPEREYDYDKAISLYWEIFNYSQLENYKKGSAAGKYAGWDDKNINNPLRLLFRAFEDVLKDSYRRSNKSTVSINFLLDILNTTLDNLDHVIEQDKIKINKQEVISYLQGFTTGLLKTKSKKEDE